jgi:hypothetical protein
MADVSLPTSVLPTAACALAFPRSHPFPHLSRAFRTLSSALVSSRPAIAATAVLRPACSRAAPRSPAIRASRSAGHAVRTSFLAACLVLACLSEGRLSNTAFWRTPVTLFWLHF